MRLNFSDRIAAALVATILVSLSLLLTACEGRKMSNMTPRGETVELTVTPTAEIQAAIAPADSLAR